MRFSTFYLFTALNNLSGKGKCKKIAWTFEVLGLWRFLDEEPQTSKTFLKKSPEYPSPTTLRFRFHAYIFRHASVSSTYPGTSVRLSVVRKWFFPISIQSASLQRWKAMDLRFNLAPSFRDLKHPTSRQNFMTRWNKHLWLIWETCQGSPFRAPIRPEIVQSPSNLCNIFQSQRFFLQQTESIFASGFLFLKPTLSLPS